MRKYLAEFIGTYFLALAVCLTNGNYFAPLAVGLLLAGLIYLFYGVSGAQYNPVTTLAVWMLNKVTATQAILIIIIQFLAAFIAAVTYNLVWGRNLGIPRPDLEINILKPLAIETILTFIMILVILRVAVSESTKGNAYYGLAIGFTVAGIAIMGSNSSGSAFNPAIGLALPAVDMLFGSCDCAPFEYAWIYAVGPVTGSIVAVFTFKFIEP